MEIPVVRRTSKEEFEIVVLNVKDVLFTYIQDDTLKYQTRTETFSQISTLEEQQKFLSNNGFQKVERGYLVQLNKIQYFDEERSCLFFEQNPGKNALSAPVSRAHKKYVEVYVRPTVTLERGMKLSNG